MHDNIQPAMRRDAGGAVSINTGHPNIRALSSESFGNCRAPTATNHPLPCLVL